MPNSILCDSDYEQDEIIQNDAGVAQDITGWTFEFLCKREGDRGGCKIELSSGSGISIEDAAAGRLRISMTAAQTKQFGPGVGRCLLWRTDDGRKIIGEGSAAFEGKFFDA